MTAPMLERVRSGVLDQWDDARSSMRKADTDLSPGSWTDIGWIARTMWRRDSRPCPTGSGQDVNGTTASGVYTSSSGLVFDTFCGMNLPFSDTQHSGPVADVSACMDLCASKSRSPCYGVSFDIPSGTCYFKNAGATTAGLTNAAGVTDTGLAHRSQLEAPNLSCGFDDNSNQKTANGMAFSVMCNTDLPSGDYVPTNFQMSPMHTDSLADCIGNCSTAHPLCKGVAWNPDLLSGYANCYPKNDVSGARKPLNSANHVTHLALVNLDSIASSCPTKSPYDTSDGSIWDISCSQGRDASYSKILHLGKLDDCLSACAKLPEQDCIGAKFQASQQNGYENCYLLNSTGVPNESQSDFVTALLKTRSAAADAASASDLSSGSSSGSSGGSSNGSSNGSASGSSSAPSTSMAWVAGPVVGGLAFLALVAALAFFLLRRRRRQREYRSTPQYDPSEAKSEALRATVHGDVAYHPLELGGGDEQKKSRGQHELDSGRSEVAELQS